MARFDFDVTEYEDVQDFEIIPENTEVQMKCIEAEGKETQSGGSMIKATFVVLAPAEYKNRRVWTNFNVVNKSEKAQNFGRKMVAGWARACGKPNAKDTDQLLEKPFWCKLGVEAGTGNYKDKNTIASYLMPEGSEAPKSEKPVSTRAAEQQDTPKSETASSKPASVSPSDKKRQPWDD